MIVRKTFSKIEIEQILLAFKYGIEEIASISDQRNLIKLNDSIRKTLQRTPSKITPYKVSLSKEEWDTFFFYYGLLYNCYHKKLNAEANEFKELSDLGFK